MIPIHLVIVVIPGDMQHAQLRKKTARGILAAEALQSARTSPVKALMSEIFPEYAFLMIFSTSSCTICWIICFIEIIPFVYVFEKSILPLRNRFLFYFLEISHFNLHYSSKPTLNIEPLSFKKTLNLSNYFIDIPIR